MDTLHDRIRNIVALLPEGEVTIKFREQPKIKPPRRRPSIKNKSQRSDYMKEYMHEYREEKGKDYQKMPDKVKKWRRRKRKALKD
jgi:hypothetical protein